MASCLGEIVEAVEREGRASGGTERTLLLLIFQYREHEKLFSEM